MPEGLPQSRVQSKSGLEYAEPDPKAKADEVKRSIMAATSGWAAGGTAEGVERSGVDRDRHCRCGVEGRRPFRDCDQREDRANRLLVGYWASAPCMKSPRPNGFVKATVLAQGDSDARVTGSSTKNPRTVSGQSGRDSVHHFDLGDTPLRRPTTRKSVGACQVGRSLGKNSLVAHRVTPAR